MSNVADYYTVVGNPIAHSRSPWLHAKFAAQTQQSMRYDRSLLDIGNFASGLSLLRANGLQGCNVTVPFKTDAFELAQWHSPAAILAQACNTLWWDAGVLKADNTDGVGLVRDITHNAGFKLQGTRLLVIGAGGAGAGILGPLIDAGCTHILLANRTRTKATEVVRRHTTLAQVRGCELSATSQDDLNGSDQQAFDVVVNASAASLGGQRIHLNDALFAPHTLAIDLMYGPSSRVFLNWAAERCNQTRDGLGMLVEQAAQSFAIWRGSLPHTDNVLRELRAIVDAPVP
jgi:shikimate dehydrogenase